MILIATIITLTHTQHMNYRDGMQRLTCFVQQLAGLHVTAEVREIADVGQCLIDLAHVLGERTCHRGQPIERGHVYVTVGKSAKGMECKRCEKIERTDQ